MKVNNKIKTVALGLLGMLALTSCNDFLTIYPTDKTIGEDYWKSKDDVNSSKAAAYQAMLAYNCQERAIIWGAFRSDELCQTEGYTNENLRNINAINLLPTNSYNSWGDFYTVINRCNQVLAHAPEVLQNDPEFLEGDYNEVRAEMLALRSLAYFYLVRTFRDIPYSTEAFENDNQFMKLPQQSPDSVLAKCIADLQESEKYIMRSGAYGVFDWRNKGYMTSEAVWALLADIYLWRGSMNHDNNDYEQCVAYCNKVIESKKAFYAANYKDNINIGGKEEEVPLLNRNSAFAQIFVMGNSYESILEWPYDGTNNANTAEEDYYYKNGENGTVSRLMATKLFAIVDNNANTDAAARFYQSEKDTRYWDNCYSVGSADATQLSIRKLVTTSASVSYNSSNKRTSEAKPASMGSYKTWSQHWIVYRLTDVMLMKAEALTALASGDDDAANLKSAFNLVKAVNDRSMDYSSYTSGDSLTFKTFNTKEKMEYLVLAERERELCFEGHRWYDLVRFAYRHMTGVNSKALLADQQSWPAIYSKMTDLVKRKYESGGDAVSYKLKSEPFFYWPIQESQIKVSQGALKQNPVYKQEETVVKN